MSKLTALLCALILFFGCHKSVRAQLSVAPSPVPEMQFFDNNGNPLSGGRVFTYLAGTTTQENTYTDASGTSQNADPIILDAGGFPANGTSRTGIWLANKSYKFIVQNSSGVTQWSADNITGYLGLLNLPNIWLFPQTFSSPITVTPSDNQIVLGFPGSQTTLDVPPSPVGGSTLHFQPLIGSDAIVNRNSVDDLTNKHLISPAIDNATENTPFINGVEVTNSPGTYIIMPNEPTTGTFASNLVKIQSSAAIVTTISDTGGVIGVAVAGVGTTGNVTIQQSGTVSCRFDGGTQSGDYVQISSTVPGDCHDAGGTYPTTGQVLGRALANSVAAPGLYVFDLFGPEINPTPRQVICANGVAATSIITNTASTALKNCQLPAGLINAVGKTFRLTAQVVAAGATTTTTLAYFGYGAGTGITNTSQLANTTSAATPNAQYQLQVTCTVTTAGASGAASCTPIISFSSNGLTVNNFASPVALLGADLTNNLYVGVLCSFGTSNALNSCTANQFSVEVLN